MGEQRDLHVGRAGVAGVEPVLLDDGGSVGLDEGHRFLLPPRRALSCFALSAGQHAGGAPATFMSSFGKRQEYSNKGGPVRASILCTSDALPAGGIGRFG